MEAIIPLPIDDDVFVSSSVPEDDYGEYSAATTYTIDDRVIVADDHLVYKCKVGCTGKTPSENIYDDSDSDNITGNWSIVSATNRWKMFDGKSRAVTTQSDEIVVKLNFTSSFNRIALVNVKATQIIVSVTNTTTGEEVYQKSLSTKDIYGIDTFYEWFFSSIKKKSKFVLNDLPTYKNTTVTITLCYPDGDVEVGEIVVGNTKWIGKVLYGYDVGVSNYPDTTEDEDGNVTLSDGIHSDTGSFTVLVEPGNIYDIKRTLDNYLATALVYVGYETQQETIIYGYPSSFSLTYSTFKIAYCSLDIEELS